MKHLELKKLCGEGESCEKMRSKDKTLVKVGIQG